MAILIGLLIVAFGALVWMLDWSVGRVDASTIGVILIVLGGLVALASRLIWEKATIDHGMIDEPRDWSSPVSAEDAPEDDTRRPRPRSAGDPPFP